MCIDNGVRRHEVYIYLTSRWVVHFHTNYPRNHLTEQTILVRYCLLA